MLSLTVSSFIYPYFWRFGAVRGLEASLPRQLIHWIRRCWGCRSSLSACRIEMLDQGLNRLIRISSERRRAQRLMSRLSLERLVDLGWGMLAVGGYSDPYSWRILTDKQFEEGGHSSSIQGFAAIVCDSIKFSEDSVRTCFRRQLCQDCGREYDVKCEANSMWWLMIALFFQARTGLASNLTLSCMWSGVSSSHYIWFHIIHDRSTRGCDILRF